MADDKENSTESKIEPNFSLRNEFSIPDFNEWKSLVEKDLKGASYDKKLKTNTYEDITLEPIYTRAHLEDLAGVNSLPGGKDIRRGKNLCGYLAKPWDICQELPIGDAEKFNAALKTALKGGQNSISVSLDLPTQLGIDSDYGKVGEVGKDGLAISALLSLSRAFDGIDINKYPIHIDAGFSALPFVMVFQAYLSNRKTELKNLSGSITADPIAFYAAKGQLPVSLDHAFEEMSSLTRWAIINAPEIKTIGVSGIPYHNAGANAVQELAFTLASALTYFNNLLERGFNIKEAENNVRASFGVGPHYFSEVAKLRAWRIIWKNLMSAFGLESADIKSLVHAHTSSFTQTQFDPYVNMLRTTTEAFSAIVGGVDSLHTNAFDEVLGESSEFSRRIARNTQIILKEESHLDRLIDPAGGSYYIETLTDEIAKSAWKLFQDIEMKGGMIKFLESGFVHESVDLVNKMRTADVKKRKSVIVGTNMYANVTEAMINVQPPDYKSFYKLRAEYLQKYRVSGDNAKHLSILDKLNKLMDVKSDSVIATGVDAVIEGATIGEISNSLRAQTTKSKDIKPLPTGRLTESFEELRKASLDWQKKTGEMPKVFLANMGPVNQYKPRADFSTGLFTSGGFDVISPPGFDTPESAVEAALKSNTDVVVICSTDETYPELVPQIASKLKEKSPNTSLVIAGYPKEQIEEHKKSGVDDFIFLGCDVVDILSKLLSKVGAMK